MFANNLIYLYLFMLLGIIIYFQYRNKQNSSPANIELDKVIAFLNVNGGNHSSHLILLQDKDIFWAQEEKVMIVYKKIGNKLIVLGDPIGEETSIHAAIREFNEYSEARGLKPVFYQINPHYMHYYHETGFRFLKLGEEGTVNLHNFTLEGKQGAKLRTRLNKFTRNNFTFSVIEPPFSQEILSELRQVSDSWLGNQKEKGFSVVSFSEEYVSNFPVAILTDQNGRIMAFATLATDYRASIAIDLMRKWMDAPHGTMDVLFIHIFKWAKDRGYFSCSLGMAPLSNVGECKHSFISERLIGRAYQHGNALYNFKGLREFKSKFACGWEPKYLAYKKTLLPVVLLQLVLLINSQPHPRYVMGKIKYLFNKAG